MAGSFGRLRRRIMTPSADRTDAGKRGFFVKDETTRELLAKTPTFFRVGFGEAVESGDAEQTGRRLDAIEQPYRGFAYEGAAMGLAVIDAMSPRRHDRIARFLAGPARRYQHGVHVGLGFALARLPRMRARLIAPSDPFLRWRSADGYGFYLAFFQAERYVDGHQPGPAAPWPGLGYEGYAPRAIDQGIGRALWFIGGADVDRVATLIGGFDGGRHADLWSGAGLAATYAGGGSEDELGRLAEVAGPFRQHIAQGAALAATTRVRADLVVPYTRMATGVLCGMSPEDAAALTDAALADLPADDDLPAFEMWRRSVAAEFMTLGRR
jgi:enediyne biosynthesis protein E3